MATASVTYNFTPLTTTRADDVDTNFNDLVTFLNNSVVHVDGSKAMTGALALPASDPTTDNHAARKAYVDKLGLMGRATVTTNQTLISTIVDVTSATITFTAEAGRNYRLVAEALVVGTVSGDEATLYITDSSNTIIAAEQVSCTTSGQGYNVRVETITTLTAGSRTFKLRLARTVGTGTISTATNVNNPVYIYAEDMGVV